MMLAEIEEEKRYANQNPFDFKYLVLYASF